MVRQITKKDAALISISKITIFVYSLTKKIQKQEQRAEIYLLQLHPSSLEKSRRYSAILGQVMRVTRNQIHQHICLQTVSLLR